MRPEIVIFDCDGVLVDSEWLAARVDAEVLAAAGFNVPIEAIYDRFTGMTDREMSEIIEAEHGRALPTGYRDEVIARGIDLFARELNAIAGAAEAVAALEECGIRTCVASSSDHQRLRRTLGQTGLLPALDGRIYSAEDVPRGKPAPDVFLHAAAGMDVAPERCLVIEDSVPGVTAAVSAGMAVWGFLGGQHIREGHDSRLQAAGAVHLFDDLGSLPALVGIDNDE